ncbi:MAG TPA: MotA/TolQ/ExbB proton channel family protein [Candidatus Babeliales bacterium]|nr:MotA/TolQ/ExbB proton channel family protein [Candidatus Babeliales bacterium]
MMGNALWQLVKQSDAISIAVLLILLVMSIVCWAVFFYKYILLRTKMRDMQTALASVKQVKSVEQIMQLASLLSGTMPGYFLSKNISFLKELLQESAEANKSIALTSNQLEMVQHTIYQTADDMIQHEESYLAVLTTSVSLSPLLGLFGTIWGLVHAFIRISEQQSADIATVAPGIAEALITTLAGLMVAIPAVAMFNYFIAKIRVLDKQLGVLADKVHTVFSTLFIR